MLYFPVVTAVLLQCGSGEVALDDNFPRRDALWLRRLETSSRVLVIFKLFLLSDNDALSRDFAQGELSLFTLYVWGMRWRGCRRLSCSGDKDVAAERMLLRWRSSWDEGVLA